MIVERRVRFVVTEAFFAPLPRELEVSTSLCGYNFEPGQAYLVDANRTSERLTVSICSRTKPLADASDDVELLRGWVRGSAEARIFGAVTLQKPEGGTAGPQSGLLVVAEATGHVSQTVTDTRGQFRFRGLPMGR